MREIRTSGSEGGVAQTNASSLPLSTDKYIHGSRVTPVPLRIVKVGLVTLAEACEKEVWEVYAWVLLDNQYHQSREALWAR